MRSFSRNQIWFYWSAKHNGKKKVQTLGQNVLIKCVWRIGADVLIRLRW